MDLGNKTLNGILQAIADENNLVGYNTYRNRKGRILVKITYEEPSECDTKEDSNSEFDSHRISFKRMSDTQSKRNYQRAKKFRDQNETVNSIETPRNSEEIDLSASTPIDLETSTCVEDSCLSESPVTRVTSDHDQSREEPFHDVPESVSSVTPDSVGSSPQEVKSEPKIWKPPPRSKFKSKVYDSEKFDCPWEAAKEPCDNINCSFGPTPDKIDHSVIGIDNIIKKCPHCDLIVCMLCRKYRGRHKKYFIRQPPWD